VLVPRLALYAVHARDDAMEILDVDTDDGSVWSGRSAEAPGVALGVAGRRAANDLAGLNARSQSSSGAAVVGRSCRQASPGQ